MNVAEINPGTNGTLGKYFATALPLTVITAWVVTAFQFEAVFPEGASAFMRMLWPIFFVIKMVKDARRKSKRPELDVFSISGYNEEGKGIPIP